MNVHLGKRIVTSKCNRDSLNSLSNSWVLFCVLSLLINTSKSKRFLQGLNKDNLACGGGNFGSLSLISFSVAAAQVGSSSSSFPFSWVRELSGAVPIDVFPAGAFGGDCGSSPAKKPQCLGVIHFSHPQHLTVGPNSSGRWLHALLLSVCVRQQSHL